MINNTYVRCSFGSLKVGLGVCNIVVGDLFYRNVVLGFFRTHFRFNLKIIKIKKIIIQVYYSTDGSMFVEIEKRTGAECVCCEPWTRKPSTRDLRTEIIVWKRMKTDLMHADRHEKQTEHTDDRTNAQRIRPEPAVFFVCEDGACWWGRTVADFLTQFLTVRNCLKPQ